MAIYRAGLADSLPAGVPSQASAAARDTLGGAAGVAQRLPADLGAALLDASREAFTTGLQVTAGISAVVAVGIAVVATVMLRGVPTTAEAAAAEPPTVAVEARRVGQLEEPEPVQLIRSGGGCVACPGDHGKPTGPLPRLRRPASTPGDRDTGAA